MKKIKWFILFISFCISAGFGAYLMFFETFEYTLVEYVIYTSFFTGFLYFVITTA